MKTNKLSLEAISKVKENIKMEYSKSSQKAYIYPFIKYWGENGSISYYISDDNKQLNTNCSYLSMSTEGDLNDGLLEVFKVSEKYGIPVTIQNLVWNAEEEPSPFHGYHVMDPFEREVDRDTTSLYYEYGGDMYRISLFIKKLVEIRGREGVDEKTIEKIKNTYECCLVGALKRTLLTNEQYGETKFYIAKGYQERIIKNSLFIRDKEARGIFYKCLSSAIHTIFWREKLDLYKDWIKPTYPAQLINLVYERMDHAYRQLTQKEKEERGIEI